jgi:hypothetical protein
MERLTFGPCAFGPGRFLSRLFIGGNEFFRHPLGDACFLSECRIVRCGLHKAVLLRGFRWHRRYLSLFEAQRGVPRLRSHDAPSDTITVYSRNDNNLLRRFRQLKAAVASTPPDSAIIDCELVARDGSGPPDIGAPCRQECAC